MEERGFVKKCYFNPLLFPEIQYLQPLIHVACVDLHGQYCCQRNTLSCRRDWVAHCRLEQSDICSSSFGSLSFQEYLKSMKAVEKVRVCM